MEPGEEIPVWDVQFTEIHKGDSLGHEFHGNQWVDEDGGFVAGAGGNRPVRQQTPPAPPKPESMPTPPSPKNRFTGFTSMEVVAPIGDKLKLGGVFNNGIQTYKMKDGSLAAGKDTRDYMAQKEIMASLIGKAIDAPVRECIPLPGGTPEQLIMPWVEGQTMSELSRDEGIRHMSNSEIDAKCCPEVARQLYDLKFFDTLVGNEDRMSNMGNLMVITPGKDMADLRDPTTKVIGIDHGILSWPEKANFLSSANECGISKERITEISKGLGSLAQMPGLDDHTTFILDRIQKGLQDAFPRLAA